MKTFDIKDYYTVEEAAETLGYTRANITRLVRTKKLPALHRGRRYLILKSDVENFIFFS